MVYPDTVQVFEDFLATDDGMIFALINSNDTDCIVNGKIPFNYMSSLRSNFNIHIDEKILMFRDTSFWDSKDQGTVVTDWGITIIPDNEKSDNAIQISWEATHHVEERGDQLVFFFSEDRNDCCPIHMNFFIKDEDEYEGAAETLAVLFTQMAQTQQKVDSEEAAQIALQKWQKLCDAGKNEEALQVLLQYREDFNTASLTDRITFHLAQQKDYDRALKILDEDIEALNEKEQLRFITYLKWLRINIFIDKESDRLLELDSSGKELEKAKENKFDYLLVKHRAQDLYISQKAPDDLMFDTGEATINVKNDAVADFGYAEKYLQEHILELPYKERRLIVPVEEYTTLDQRTLIAIHIDRLGKIDFPLGHPVANHLYVGHPLIPSKYIPFENYELELIEDRVREFGILAQALGATSITIECINTNNSDGNISSEVKRTGNVDYGLSSANGSMEGKSNSRFLSEIGKRINLHQEFSPKEMPHIPNGLVWYANEPSWQRLVEQRLKGTLNVHEERIETRKSQVVENSELQKIAAEVEVLFVAANGSWEKSMNQMFEAHENAILSIHVEFAPIESLTMPALVDKQNIQQPAIQNTQPVLTEDEQDYLNELKECLSNDGEISNGERRLLDKFRLRLGISETRAMELEANLTKPKLVLTADEQEYLTEYKEALSDGELTALSRRLLNKLRSSMRISEERAKEIEDSIK